MPRFSTVAIRLFATVMRIGGGSTEIGYSARRARSMCSVRNEQSFCRQFVNQKEQ